MHCIKERSIWVIRRSHRTVSRKWKGEKFVWWNSVNLFPYNMHAYKCCIAFHFAKGMNRIRLRRTLIQIQSIHLIWPFISLVPSINHMARLHLTCIELSRHYTAITEGLCIWVLNHSNSKVQIINFTLNKFVWLSSLNYAMKLS
jgi:hypothetical protein